MAGSQGVRELQFQEKVIKIPEKSALNNNNNYYLFNVYTYNDHPYILLFSFIILYNTHIYVRVTLSQKAVSETDRVPIIVFTILLALHLYTKYVYKLSLHLEICAL